MKLVVTGAGGALARAVLAVAGGHEVVALTHADLDVGDPVAVAATIPACDAIVHLAAFTDVDGCERDPARAQRDNADAVGHVAAAAAACGAALLHVSTDYVFDGAKATPYDEADVPAPVSVYGRTKLAGETRAREVAEHLVVRAGSFFGTGQDFATRAAIALAGGAEVGAIADRVVSPTYVPDLAPRLLALLAARRWGTYHLGGPEATTWFDVLDRVVRIGGLAGRVVAQRAADLDLRAPRPANAALTSIRLATTDVPGFPPLDDALTRLLTDVRSRTTGSP